MKKDSIPLGFVTLRQTLQLLNDVDIDLSYNGLQFYIKKKILPKPIRIKGYMNKYWHILEVYQRIVRWKLLQTLRRL